MSVLGVQVERVVVSGEQRVRLLELVAACPGIGVARALRDVGVAGTKGQLRDFVANDLELADDLQEARSHRLRDELMARAVDGVEETVITGAGVKVTRTVKSDRLLEFACRMYLPEARVLRSGNVEISGADGAPVEVNVRHDYDQLLARLAEAGVVRLGGGEGGDVDAEAAGDAERPALLPARAD